MKYGLVAVSFAALALAGCTTGVRAPTEQFKFDRMLPSSPELERGGLRDYAGGIEQFSSIQIQLG
jgi:hypothetical protein